MQAYEHQQKIIEEDPKKCLIALGTGGGKTLTCLRLARGKTLVVCPKQQKLDRTWERNAEKFGIELELVVCSKEEFKKTHTQIKGIETLIFDECHTILGVTPDTRQRNGARIPRSSQLYEACVEFVGNNQPGRIYLASATPVTKPMHLWALATLFGRKWDFFRFRERFYVEIKQGFRTLWLPRKDQASREKLAELTRSFGYTGQLSDWFNVPEQHHETIYVELTEEQNSAIGDIQLEEADPMAVRARIRTIENGILYGMDFLPDPGNGGKVVGIGRSTQFFDSRKSEEICRLSERFNKVLIFCAYTGQVASLTKRLQSEYPSRQVWTLTGQTKDRGTVIQEAEAAEEGIVIAQASISAGYELPSYPCTVFASKSYRYVDYEQALGRTLRANAIKENWYYHLVVRGGPDEACHEAIQSGSDFQEMIMEN